ncbi:MAG TPA: tripartite tricarboxylate transporter substrate-binding protein, partial [Burkholderiales bacterium]|nr:tripartite tricarboxylate transporter substrate-binding protein [Burkholderiales bacterium]
MQSKAILAAATCCAISVLSTLHYAAAAESAAAYPSKPVRLIIANTSGTSVDTLGRVIALKMGEVLGQQVVCDNRGGAGGIIGAEIAAHSAPDGYTLLVTSTGVQVITPQLYKKLNYDPIRDFAQISMFALTQNILVTYPGLPVNSVKDLLAYAKANPGKLNMANAGTGFQSHLAGVLFTHMTGINVHHVPYKGGASLIAVMGNESQFTIAPGPALIGHVRSGRLRALASGGEKRSSLMPDLPTISETVPGYVSTGWSGLVAPKATPKPILDKV